MELYSDGLIAAPSHYTNCCSKRDESKEFRLKERNEREQQMIHRALSNWRRSCSFDNSQLLYLAM